MWLRELETRLGEGRLGAIASLVLVERKDSVNLDGMITACDASQHRPGD